MTKFKKKPILIEAEQFFIDKKPYPDGVISYKRSIHHPYEYEIKTLEGRCIVKDRDWIITGIKGEKYPCKNDIFEMTYESTEKTIYDRSLVHKTEKVTEIMKRLGCGEDYVNRSIVAAEIVSFLYNDKGA